MYSVYKLLICNVQTLKRGAHMVGDIFYYKLYVCVYICIYIYIFICYIFLLYMNILCILRRSFARSLRGPRSLDRSSFARSFGRRSENVIVLSVRLLIYIYVTVNMVVAITVPESV